MLAWRRGRHSAAALSGALAGALGVLAAGCRSETGRAAAPASSSAVAAAAPSAAPLASAPAPPAPAPPRCPQGEVLIPATGPEGFVMGRGKAGEDDQEHRVVISRDFCIDRTEVTVAAYRRCVEAGKCTEPQLRDRNSNYRPELARDRHPVNMVNWMQARQYCESRGQTLPTEAQWEWAAAGPERSTYPWGDEPEPTCENGHADFTPEGSPKTDPAGDVGCHGGGSSPVGSHPSGRRRWPDGDVHDLAGNLWEWTADCFLPYPAEKQIDPSPQQHPRLAGDCYVRALRGGGWNRSRFALRTHARAGSKRTYRVPGLGFRCVRAP